tara:strand:- start:5582 stop:5917 length:336 start_codon:yes stop_codon:yes gene_type:complete
MANLQDYSLQERMNSINGDDLHEYTYREALNKKLKSLGTHNSVDYSGISYQKYTSTEALNIIYKNSGYYDMTSQEVLNLMVSGNTNKYKYTEQEALNEIENSTNFNNGIPS